jgi:5'-methylthioadenosine phosphorylase
MEKASLGVIGGSGIYNIEGLTDVRDVVVDTPFGKTSDVLRTGKIGGLIVVFVPRHGLHHNYLPSEVPYQANIWALKSLGVKWILSCSAVGSLKEEIKPQDIVLCDQFIDRTTCRPISFFGDGIVGHVSLADPFSDELIQILADVIKPILPAGKALHESGTYLCMEGPAFSTRAESNVYRSWGCSVIGMTNHTEARLAREAEIAYSSIAMITDYDCWHTCHDAVSVDMVIENLTQNSKLAKEIVVNFAKRMDMLRPICLAHSAAKNSIMTQKEYIPEDTLQKIKLIFGSYI